MASPRKLSEGDSGSAPTSPVFSPTRVGSDYAGVAGVGEITRKTSKMEVRKDSELLGASQSLDIRGMLEQESEAYRNADAPNMASIYVVKKAHSKMATIKRARAVLVMLSTDGMPSVIMIASPQIFSAWDTIRGKTQKEISGLSADFSRYGKATPGWPFNFSPRETKNKLIEDCRFFQLVHLDGCEQDKSNPAVMRLFFAEESDGTERKGKAFEFRPEPYSKGAAAHCCAEVVSAIRAGMVHSYLQRPSLVDRSIKQSALRLWLDRIKLLANEKTIHGKTNLHHQVQLESPEQLTKVKDLLSWGADANAVYGPTRMTPLHMAASWRKPEIVDALLKAGGDPSVTDINGMTPLHLACVFGCADSVELLYASGKVDINAEATNALGTLRPLDCMLECEDKNAIPIWHSLQAKGVDMNYTRTVQSHPLPYPTQKVGPFLAAIIAMHRLRETETELDISKVELLLQDGADPNVRDAFGRTALCYTSSDVMTELLLTAGADPNLGVPPPDLGKYVTGCAGRAYVDMMLVMLDRLKNEAYPSSGRVAPEAATNMANTILEFKNSICGAVRRAQFSGTPLGEALAQGKTGKTHALLEAGANPCISHSLPTVQLDLTWFLADGCEDLERFQELAGEAVWDGLATRLLWFTRFYCPAMPVRGSQMLQSRYSTAQATMIAEHLHTVHGSEVAEKIAAAERSLPGVTGATRGAIDVFEPKTQEVMECQELTTHALSTLPVPDQQTYTKLSEDEAISQVVAAEFRARTRSTANQKLNKTDTWKQYRERTMSVKRTTQASKKQATDVFARPTQPPPPPPGGAAASC
eukprot:m.437041 g.437041  ORF g.437041 m.437041 type:complete len:813 (+) comp18053_c0_seq1:210-2648(+)